MNFTGIRSWLLKSRGAGNTTALCHTAKAAGAVVVFATVREAQRAGREFGIDTVSLHQAETAGFGNPRPVLLDVQAADALLALADDLTMKAADAERKMMVAMLEKEKAEIALASARASNEYLTRKIAKLETDLRAMGGDL